MTEPPIRRSAGGAQADWIAPRRSICSELVAAPGFGLAVTAAARYQARPATRRGLGPGRA